MGWVPASSVGGDTPRRGVGQNWGTPLPRLPPFRDILGSESHGVAVTPTTRSHGTVPPPTFALLHFPLLPKPRGAAGNFGKQIFALLSGQSGPSFFKLEGPLGESGGGTPELSWVWVPPVFQFFFGKRLQTTQFFGGCPSGEVGCLSPTPGGGHAAGPSAAVGMGGDPSGGSPGGPSSPGLLAGSPRGAPDGLPARPGTAETPKDSPRGKVVSFHNSSSLGHAQAGSHRGEGRGSG